MIFTLWWGDRHHPNPNFHICSAKLNTETHFLLKRAPSIPPLPSEGNASSGQPTGPSADPSAGGDPSAQSGASVPPSQGDAGRRNVRAGGVRRGVGPAVWHPHEGCLCSVHPSKASGPHQDEYQLQAFLTVLKTAGLTHATEDAPSPPLCLCRHYCYKGLFPLMAQWGKSKDEPLAAVNENENVDDFDVCLGMTCMRKPVHTDLQGHTPLSSRSFLLDEVWAALLLTERINED